ncbi:MAG: sensor histidine kinase [Gammaproteobacteria bacterium]|nr:sensor histidine kinase [Gammaproteobacteria bacterium]
MKHYPQLKTSEQIKVELAKDSVFLPDFCNFRMVFAVVIIGELLAFVLTLVPLRMDQQLWSDLALISLFIQWNGLMCSSVLCLIRPLLKNYSNEFVAVCSYLAILIMITFLSELTFYLMETYYLTEMISSASHWEFLVHNLLIGGIIGALALHYFYLQYQWRIKVQAESCTKLQLLQARIRPHFLFNSMNTIASLTRTRPEVAERVTEDLAELFRMLFRKDHEMIDWSRELMLSEHYINIEKQRLDKRLSIEWQVSDIPDDAMVPALILQPLLENAVFHGIEPEIHGGRIIVSGEFSNNQLKIIVQNTNSANLVHRQGNKMALENIKERLNVHFQGKASIVCEENSDEYLAIMTMPYRTKEDL